MERSKRLGDEKVLKLLVGFSLPAIIGMLVNALYNVIDRIFVGWGVGYEGIAGITVDYPIQLLMMAFAMLIGFGANSLFSIRLGEQKREDAEKILGNALTLLLAASVILGAIGLFLLNPMLRLLGASPTILPYARDYMNIILWGTPFMMIGMGMNNFIRSEGNPAVAMLTMLIGAVLNAILAPIFVFGFRWGIKGSAFATVISQAVSAAWVLLYFLTGKSSTRFHKSNLSPDRGLISKALAIGVAPFSMQAAASLINGILNQSLGYYGGLSKYGGDVAISGMGVVSSIAMLILMPIFGINQGAQPIIGYNYGARKFDRVKQALTYAMAAATSVTLIGFAVIMIFPSQLISLFGENEKELVEFGAFAIRIFLIFLPIIGFQIVGANYFQAIGKPVKAAFLSLSRQVILLIPALLILPRFLGLHGVLYAGPLSDFGASVLTGCFLFFELKRLDQKHARTLEPQIE